MNESLKGKFLVLDGPDGCGKSTQTRLLSEWIAEQGVDVASYRDPGTTLVGEKIRDILLDTAHEGMGDNVEVLLYMAARAQLYKEHIAPDLAMGKCVLMDRWLSSTCAYQGWAGGFGIEKVIKIATDSLDRIWPDLTVVLDVDLQTAAERMQRDLDRMEQKGDAYHAKVREGFLKLPKIHSSIKVVDARQPVENVHQDVLKLIQGL
ncbi:MAG: dTMP kinase [Planctomycetota bacterium]|jgi:dTMP kinase